MLTDENKALFPLLSAMMNSCDEFPLTSLEKALFNAYVWHFNEKRSWSDELIKKQAITVEIDKLENLLNGKATDQDTNYYLNQFNQYLHYNFSENLAIQAELMRLLKEGKLKLTFKDIRQIFKEKLFRRKYKSHQAFLNTIERDANDLSKIGSPNINKRLNNILTGYMGKNDERAEPLFKSLLQFKTYLESYGKLGNELVETRIKSNLKTEDIEAYFSKLMIINNTETKYIGKPIVSKEELNTFLHANFRNFNPAQHKVMISANCSNATLTRVMYEFFELESKKESTSASVFHKMLKENFANFKATELKTIKKEFSRVHPVHFPFH